MAKNPARGIRTRQNAVLRYSLSTSLEETAKDFGVTPKQLANFLRKKPDDLSKSKSKAYKRLLAADAKAVARDNDVKLVSKLYGERYARTLRNQNTPRKVKSVQYTKATKTKRRLATGKYENIITAESQRQSVISSMTYNPKGYSVRYIRQEMAAGRMSESEARSIVANWRKLYKSPKITFARFFE